MPEDDKNTQQQGDGTGNAGANGAAGQSGGAGQRDAGQNGQFADPVAYALAMEKRWQEEKEARQTLARQLADYESQRQVALQQNGQFEELFKSAQAKNAEYEPKVKAYDELLEEIRSENKRRIEALPEDVRGLVPQLDPVSQRRWLDAAQNNPRFMGVKAPGVDAGAGLGGGGGTKVAVTDADRQAAQAAQAQGHHVTAEDIAKRRAQGPIRPLPKEN